MVITMSRLDAFITSLKESSPSCIKIKSSRHLFVRLNSLLLVAKADSSAHLRPLPLSVLQIVTAESPPHVKYLNTVSLILGYVILHCVKF